MGRRLSGDSHHLPFLRKPNYRNKERGFWLILAMSDVSLGAIGAEYLVRLIRDLSQRKFTLAQRFGKPPQAEFTCRNRRSYLEAEILIGACSIHLYCCHQRSLFTPPLPRPPLPSVGKMGVRENRIVLNDVSNDLRVG